MASRLLLAVAAACLAAALAAATARYVSSRAPEPTAPAVAAAVAADPVRIRYPASAYPALVLPGGQRRSIRSVLNIPGRMRFGDYVWNEDGVAEGPIWIRVDLATQLVSVFRDGHEIGSAVILYGATGKPTPTGSFTVLQKAADYWSKSYDAPMPFMLRLTADGVAIHASNVREGWATHGCIGVPPEFARKVFAQAHLGDTVVIVGADAKTGAAHSPIVG